MELTGYVPDTLKDWYKRLQGVGESVAGIINFRPSIPSPPPPSRTLLKPSLPVVKPRRAITPLPSSSPPNEPTTPPQSSPRPSLRGPLPPFPPNFVVTNMEQQTAFGHIKYTTDNYDTISPKGKEIWFMIYYPHSKENARGTLYVYTSYFGYKNYETSTQPMEELQKKNAIKYTFARYIHFKLKDSFHTNSPILFVLDKPSTNVNRPIKGFHQDGIHSTVSNYIRAKYGIVFREYRSNYTIIQYFPEDRCVGTTIYKHGYPYLEEQFKKKKEEPGNTLRNSHEILDISPSTDFVRYYMCSGSTLCINNQEFLHSTPYPMKMADRALGDDLVEHDYGKERSFLARFQVYALDPSKENLNGTLVHFPHEDKRKEKDSLTQLFTNPQFLTENKDFQVFDVDPQSLTITDTTTREIYFQPSDLEQVGEVTVMSDEDYINITNGPQSFEIGGSKKKSYNSKKTTSDYILFQQKVYKVHQEKGEPSKRYIQSKPLGGKVLLSSIRGKYRYTEK